MKRSFTEWLSGSKATPSFPPRPRKRATASFSRACGIFQRGVTTQNLTSKNRPCPAKTEQKKYKKNCEAIFSRIITDEVKRSFTEWLSGSKATPSFPPRPRKRATASFSRACGIFQRGVTTQNLTSKNRPCPAKTEQKKYKKNCEAIFSRMITDEVKRKLHEVAKRKQGERRASLPAREKERKRFFEDV